MNGGSCIHILQLRSPVRALPSYCETPVRCCSAFATSLVEARAEFISPHVTVASLQQGTTEPRPIFPSQHSQQALSPGELPCLPGKGIKISSSEAGLKIEGCGAGRWGYLRGVLWRAALWLQPAWAWVLLGSVGCRNRQQLLLSSQIQAPQGPAELRTSLDVGGDADALLTRGGLQLWLSPAVGQHWRRDPPAASVPQNTWGTGGRVTLLLPD